MQSRKRSLYEAFSSQVFGIAYAIPLNYVMITWIKWENLWYYATINTLTFVLVGLAFKYALRRFFNWLDIEHPPE